MATITATTGAAAANGICVMDTESCWATQEITEAELKLLNLVAATLLYEARYYSSADDTRTKITNAVKDVCDKGDPEFVLKLALYVRDDLNIRSTANFLLALAATTEKTKPFLGKYFSASVRLPTDVFEIYALTQQLNSGTIPACLRTAIQKKWAEFDTYQLGKYNNEGKTKRKRLREKQKQRAKEEKEKKLKELGITPKPPSSNTGNRRGLTIANVTINAAKKPKLPTMKALIRSLHISQPVESVMCILGKKYPRTAEEFIASKLPGEFNPEMAGKRMKLPVPETWETLVSALGNKKETWMQLIDHKKLPFMAMLRNLRNILLCGMPDEYHRWIIEERLTNESAVAASRQFPFRFLSAYDILKQIRQGQLTSTRRMAPTQLQPRRANRRGAAEELTEEQKAYMEKREARLKEIEEKRKAREAKLVRPPTELLDRYEDAVDTAIKIAIHNNVPHLRGYSLAMCDISGSMRCPVSTAKGGFGSSITTAYDISILLGLMMRYICEKCDMYLFGSTGLCGKPYYLLNPPKEDSILHNVDFARRKAMEELTAGNEFFYELFEDLIARQVKVDRMVIFTDVMIDGLQSQGSLKHGGIEGIVGLYRKKVNPDFYFIMVDLYGSGRSIVNVEEKVKHPRDILIGGFSDQIFRFLAQREGAESQLDYVRKIDQTKLVEINKKKQQQQERKQQQQQRDLNNNNNNNAAVSMMDVEEEDTMA